MSRQKRPVQTVFRICDLCDEEISEHLDPGERGSITRGFIAHKVRVPETKWAWLTWPPAGRDRLKDYEWRQRPENKPRQYDFHADCILRLVEQNLGAYKPKTNENEGA